jgi:hypothetical protein
MSCKKKQVARSDSLYVVGYWLAKGWQFNLKLFQFSVIVLGDSESDRKQDKYDEGDCFEIHGGRYF